MTVLMLAGAEEDLDEAFAYYQSAQAGLGDDLLFEFRRSVDLILRHPRGWQRMDDLYRRCRLHRFPYGVVYRVDEAAALIVITTVMQMNRRPGSWRRL